jgi:energy-coupling factor transporter ATP-binding protein EcfA2
MCLTLSDFSSFCYTCELLRKNNSGKTSLLEAISLLRSHDYSQLFKDILLPRGEVIWDESSKKYNLDITHLFYEHQLDPSSYLKINGKIDPVRISSLDEDPKSIDGLILKIQRQEKNRKGITINLNAEPNNISVQWSTFPFSIQTGADPNLIHNSVRSTPIFAGRIYIRLQLITSMSLSFQKIIELFDRVALTDEEDIVTDALKILEPSVNRIAVLSPERHQHPDLDAKGGFFVKLSGTSQRLPLGSMGEGMTRLLGLALALVNVKGGILLVDEIDTELHFSTLSDMWKMIWYTAKKLDIQVFATTHNSDCWMSLAETIRSEEIEPNQITIQRIEKGKDKAVMFDQEEIEIAADRGIEVR